MKRRYTVLFLSLVLALALAVPALGGPNNPIASVSATVKQTATKALKKAKAAQNTANAALSTATAAQSDAAKAQSTANSAQKAASAAQGTANTALSTANSAKAAADAAQATANTKLGETFTEFGGGSGTSTTSGFDSVGCPGDSEITGGGFTTNGAGSNEIVPIYTGSYGDAWIASMERIPGGASSWNVQAIAICAQ
jgi:membrane protein involved in colicin uptake